LGDQIEKNEMGGACGTYETEERCTQDFWRGNLRKRYHLADPEVDGSIILNCILKKRERTWTGLIWLRIETGDGLL
jgi:hypothetical protein